MSRVVLMFFPSMQELPDLRPPMTVITDKLVKLVQSTGLQKTNTAHQLEVDAQDPSFITTRPYFEPSSTGISLETAASLFLYSLYLSLYLFDCLISQSGCNRELHPSVTKICSSPQIVSDIMILWVLEVTWSIWSIAALFKYPINANWWHSKLLRWERTDHKSNHAIFDHVK